VNSRIWLRAVDDSTSINMVLYIIMYCYYYVDLRTHNVDDHTFPISIHTAHFRTYCLQVTTSKTLCLLSAGRYSVFVAGPKTFNALPDKLRDPTVNTTTFRRLLKTQFFSSYLHV